MKYGVTLHGPYEEGKWYVLIGGLHNAPDRKFTCRDLKHAFDVITTECPVAKDGDHNIVPPTRGMGVRS
jgi:hypothetical protein